MEFEEGEIDDLSEGESVSSFGQSEDKSERDGLPTAKDGVKRKKYRSSQHADSNHSKHTHSSKVNGHSKASKNSRHHRKKVHTNVKEHNHDKVVSGLPRKHQVKDEENRHRRKRRRIEKIDHSESQMRCRYYMEGRCAKGEDCPYRHDFEPPKKQELCKFYAVGVCSKGSDCIFMHGEFPCKFFHMSGRCGHGNACKFSHNRLNDMTHMLLDRISGPKDSLSDHELPPPASSRREPCVYSEHGDVDYRFGQRIPFGRPDSIQHRPRLRPPPSYHPDRRNMENARDLLGPVPFPRFPHSNERMERPRFFNDIRPPVSSHNGPHFPPHRFPEPRLPPAPYPLPLSSCPPVPIDPLLRLPGGILPPRMPIHDPHPRVMQHPRLPPMPIPPPFPAPFSSSEALVSSELDKIAALLASSNTSDPPKPQISSSPCDPRINQSPVNTSKTEESDIQSIASNTFEHIETDTSIGEQRRTSVSFSSPELNVMPQAPVVTTPNRLEWRLIPLDVHVKIPYPLMQLAIADIPHRFDDPRLRGQLTTLRLKTKSVSSDVESIEENLPTTQVHQTDEENTPVTNDDTTKSRRPVRLQLNEMASTFANAHLSQTSNFPKRSDGRSYLDDPRFRRRRVISSTNTSQIIPASDATEAH